MFGCFFAKEPSPDLALLLRALDCSDLMELAAMFGEARDRFENPDLMKAINERMAKVIAPHPTTGARHHERA